MGHQQRNIQYKAESCHSYGPHIRRVSQTGSPLFHYGRRHWTRTEEPKSTEKFNEYKKDLASGQLDTSSSEENLSPTQSDSAAAQDTIANVPAQQPPGMASQTPATMNSAPSRPGKRANLVNTDTPAKATAFSKKIRSVDSKRPSPETQALPKKKNTGLAVTDQASRDGAQRPTKRPRTKGPEQAVDPKGEPRWLRDPLGMWQPIYGDETEAPSMQRTLAAARADTQSVREAIRADATSRRNLAGGGRYAHTNVAHVRQQGNSMLSFDESVALTQLEMADSDEEDGGMLAYMHTGNSSRRHLASGGPAANINRPRVNWEQEDLAPFEESMEQARRGDEPSDERWDGTHK